MKNEKWKIMKLLENFVNIQNFQFSIFNFQFKPAIMLIICLISLLSQSAFSYTLTAGELNKTIYNKINSEAKKELKNTEYKININGQITDVISNETVAPNIQISAMGEFNPVSYRRVTIKDSKGNILKTIPLNVHISIYENVLVANENISYGKNIDLGNAKFERKEVSKYYSKTITKMPKDIIASRNILKGNVILQNSIKKKAVIEKNQNVDIVFQGKGVQITLQGKALNEGAVGDKILVRSNKYSKTYTAKVDSDSKVTVRI